MNRRSFPSGQASTALLKAMLCALTGRNGGLAANAWLAKVRIARDDLEDETRLVPLVMLHKGLAAFAATTSRDKIPDLWEQLVAPELLGHWVRARRGSSRPAQALERLDASDSEYGRTTRWDTLEATDHSWRGRLTYAHDPEVEEDGLLALARLAELRAVPALFGFDGAQAQAHPPTIMAATQDYEVRWRSPRVVIASEVGAAAGAVLGAGLAAAGVAPLQTMLFTAAGGAIVGAVRARERLRRAEVHSHATRVQALERSLLLRESNERVAAGQLEGSVAAGQYRIGRRMDAGATGVIYEAVRIADGMPVAIKLLRAAAAHEGVASDRLRREAEALGLSWHPNVVEVLDQGHLPDGTAYLVMELLNGESLATRLRSKERLTTRELLPIAMQMCDALAAVHAAGVVHRDLKPSNVFLAVDSDDPAGGERVKILDFGIARVEWEETRITNTGGPVGTPGYMAPEQEVGSPDIDARTDLFAVGAILYECLVGEPPPPLRPSGLVRMGTDRAFTIIGVSPRAASLVTPAWRTVIEKAMSPSPGDRYQDARAFAAALREMREEVATVGS
jgi:serine/threonine-protein kinase